MGYYKDNKLEGEHVIYNLDGSIKSKSTYKNDKKIYKTKQLKVAGEMRETIVVNNVPEEYEYLRQEYPEYTFKKQTAIQEGDMVVDVLTIENAKGQQKDIYFDIGSSDYYKKLKEAFAH